MTFQDTTLFVKTTSKEAVTRLDPRTTGGWFKKVRDVAAVIATVGLIVTEAPISIPVSILVWIKWGTVASSIIVTEANLDKSKKLLSKLKR